MPKARVSHDTRRDEACFEVVVDLKPPSLDRKKNGRLRGHAAQVLTVAQLHHVGVIRPHDDRQDENHWEPLDGLDAPPARTVLLAHSVYRPDGVRKSACPTAALINNALTLGPLERNGIAALHPRETPTAPRSRPLLPQRSPRKTCGQA